jgi:hypothetical protein
MTHSNAPTRLLHQTLNSSTTKDAPEKRRKPDYIGPPGYAK